MNRVAAIWLTILLAVGVMAGSVMYAARAQETTAETNFAETQTASNMRTSMLLEDRALDGFLGTGNPVELEPYFAAKRSLGADLVRARVAGADDPRELQLLARQAVIFARWQVQATIDLAAAKASSLGGSPPPADRVSDGLIATFLSVNSAYSRRLGQKRRAEEARAALVPVWLICGLSGLLGVAGWAYVRRARRTRSGHDRDEQAEREFESKLIATQARFAEAIQVSESQFEAHLVIAHHLETAISGGEVIILNRNNSADRLEPATPLRDDHDLLPLLRDSKPRSCLAVRLNRQYERGTGQDEILTCSICGALDKPSTCEPLLVGGEVIGSVLLAVEHPLTEAEERVLVESVAQAAPALANLRNLALAENRAATDALTGLPNRRAVDDTLKQMLAQASRSESPLSVVLLDLDNFKKINDTAGHDRGDEVLAAFGALIREELRDSDLGGRTGGEEFVLLLPDTDRDGALALASKVRGALHQIRVRDVDLPVTASFGIATFPTDAPDAGTLLKIADRALYSAKRNGRDRIETAVVASPMLEPISLVQRATDSASARPVA